MVSNAALLNVLIYSGPGTCKFSVNQTLKTLKKFLRTRYDVKLTGLDVLKNEKIPWDEGCALFVIPGGQDLQYLEAFKNTSIVKRIKSAIDLGKMKYLGICAGAYFAADRIEFEIGREGYEIRGERPLKLINSLAIGALKSTKQFLYSEEGVENGESLDNVAVNIENVQFKVAYNGGCYFPEAPNDQVLATTNDGEPIILLNEKFCLSGVHFEYDPIDGLNSKNASIYSSLLPYENERRNMIQMILRKMSLSVSDTSEPEILDKIIIQTPNVEAIKYLQSCINNSSIELVPTEMVESHEFFIMRSRICSSTQTILLSEAALLDALPNYSVYFADHQVNGKGRGNNYWISSPACLQFTMKVEHPIDRSQRLPLLQFLMATAIAETVNSLKFTDEGVKARIKWPNDIYLFKGSESIGKVSGILVNCLQSHRKGVSHVLIGTGVNLLSDPNLPNVIHLNDYLSENTDKNEFMLKLIRRFGDYYEDFLGSDEFPVASYYKNWLHTGQLINDERGQALRIRGIDEFGYLLAADSDQKVYKFEPDGNSFDMMCNMIKRKS